MNCALCAIGLVVALIPVWLPLLAAFDIARARRAAIAKTTGGAA